MFLDQNLVKKIVAWKPWIRVLKRICYQLGEWNDLTQTQANKVNKEEKLKKYNTFFNALW